MVKCENCQGTFAEADCLDIGGHVVCKRCAHALLYPYLRGEFWHLLKSGMMNLFPYLALGIGFGVYGGFGGDLSGAKQEFYGFYILGWIGAILAIAYGVLFAIEKGNYRYIGAPISTTTHVRLSLNSNGDLVEDSSYTTPNYSLLQEWNRGYNIGTALGLFIVGFGFGWVFFIRNLVRYILDKRFYNSLV